MYNYCVFGLYGSGDSLGIIVVIDKFIFDGMNVINLLLGDDSNNLFDLIFIVVNNVMFLGVVIVVVVGNFGLNLLIFGLLGVLLFVIMVGVSDSFIFLLKLLGYVG